MLNIAKVCLGFAIYDVQIQDISRKNKFLYHFQNQAKLRPFISIDLIFITLTDILSITSQILIFTPPPTGTCFWLKFTI